MRVRARVRVRVSVSAEVLVLRQWFWVWVRARARVRATVRPMAYACTGALSAEVLDLGVEAWMQLRSVRVRARVKV